MLRTSTLALAAVVAAGMSFAPAMNTQALAYPVYSGKLSPKFMPPPKLSPLPPKVFPKLPPKIVLPLPPKLPPKFPPKFPKPPKWHPPVIVTPGFVPKPVYVGIERPVYVAKAVAAVPSRGPCTCLTKEYTLKGEIVFRDLCTQESASALIAPSAAPAAEPAPVPQQSSEAENPNNFAGKTYQDFLAANAAPPAAN